MWIGSLAFSPQWGALFLGIGAGAIMQVIVEVSAYLVRSNEDRHSALLSPAALGGFLFGLSFMFITAALIKV
jgi:zinc transporter, ZIP family